MTKLDKSVLQHITSPKPQESPSYIVGEAENWDKFITNIKTFEAVEETYGGTIQGITGNGKTHFIRYAKNQLKDDFNIFIIEDMFSQSDFLDSLRSIYRKLIENDDDSSNRLEELVKKLKNIKKKKEEVKKRLINDGTKTTLELFNPLIDELASLEAIERYPSRILNHLKKHIDDPDLTAALVKLFSGEIIQNPEDLKLLEKLNLKRNYLIEKEDDFVDYFIDYIELVYAISGKNTLIFMDEADRAIALDSSATILPKIAFQVLDSLREVFNKLRTPTFFTIGTTTQAWQLIENASSAFSRRFNRFEIVLKEGKSEDEIREFIQKRCEEKGLNYQQLIDEQIITDNLIAQLSYFSNTWTDVINNIKKYVTDNTLVKNAQPSFQEIEKEILRTLSVYRNLELSEIISNNQILKEIYPNKKSIPVSIMNNLYKNKLVDRYKKGKSSPYIYSITEVGESYLKSK